MNRLQANSNLANVYAYVIRQGGGRPGTAEQGVDFD